MLLPSSWLLAGSALVSSWWRRISYSLSSRRRSWLVYVTPSGVEEAASSSLRRRPKGILVVSQSFTRRPWPAFSLYCLLITPNVGEVGTSSRLLARLVDLDAPSASGRRG